MRIALSYLLIPVLWLLGADLLRLAPSSILPPLQDTLAVFAQPVVVGQLIADMLASGLRWAFGFSGGVLCGLTVGVLLGMQPRLQQLFHFPVEFFRFLPVTAIFPLFLILFGTGDASKIAMIFYSSFFIVLVNSSYGIAYQNRTRIEMARSVGCNGQQIFWHVSLYEALPHIFIGMRIALSISLIVTIVSEMFIGTDTGLGQSLYNAYLMNSTPKLYLYLLVIGLLGYLLNTCFRYIEKRTLFWVTQS